LTLVELARDGSATHRLARRPSALVLLDDGMNCEQVAKVLLLDDDTIRRWHGAFAQGSRRALMRFEAGGSACALSEAQREKLVAWVRTAPPRSTHVALDGSTTERVEGMV
jgi:transposase